jgi:hypothetical protein
MTSRGRSTVQREVAGIVARRQGQSDLAAAQIQISEVPLREAVVTKSLGKRNRVGARLTRHKNDATKLDSIGLSTGDVKMPWVQILQRAPICNGNHALRQPNSSAEITECNITDLCEDVGGPGRLQWYVARIKEATAGQHNSSAAGLSGTFRPPLPDFACVRI